ncbi:hypothetical protein EST38_g11238 [Candolleomyces aberdarensis]|uniref:Uncharacterized protein n=1 Tax=Candolleomyces aberdarensis TaxID=2316362 RepID=A0A4Q2D7P4_9AGAR|nr:hypothetical protein EST38_g11238 [Candolleomyces aberdarensis]
MFTIMENLNTSRNYAAIVGSDLDDETTWTWVGQFVISNSTTADVSPAPSPSSGKPNLKVILPVSIIGSLIVISIFVLIVFFLRRRAKNKKQAQLVPTYPPTPRVEGSDEKFEFSLVRPRGERSSILPSITKSRSAGGAGTGGSTTKSSSKNKGSGSTRGIVIPSGRPRQIENVNEYGLQFEPLDLTSGENNNSNKKGKSPSSSREGGSAKSPSSPSRILNVVSDEDELLEAQQALAYRPESRNAFNPLPNESTKSFSPNRPTHSHSQSHSTFQSHSTSQPQSASSQSRHPTISMVSHNEHNIHSRHNSRKWDSRSVKSSNTAEMLVKDMPYLPYLHRIVDQDGTLISVKSNNSQSMEGSGSGEHGAATSGMTGSAFGGSHRNDGGTTTDHDSPTSNLNPFGIPSTLPSHQQGRHPYATAGGTIAHRASGASSSSHDSHRSSGLMYPPHLLAMVTGAGVAGGDSTSQAAAFAQSHSRSAREEPAPRGVAEFGSKASLGSRPTTRKRTNSSADGEEAKRKEGNTGGGQGVSSVLGSLRMLGTSLQPNRRRQKSQDGGDQPPPQPEQRQTGYLTPKKSSSSTSLKTAQISAPMPIKPTRPPLVGSSSPPSSFNAPNPNLSGTVPPPAPTPTPPLGAGWTKRKAVPKLDDLEAAGGSGSGSTTKVSGSSTSLVAAPPPLPLPTQEKPRERTSSSPVPPPRAPSRPPSRQRQHRQVPDPEPQPEIPIAAGSGSGAIRPLPPRPLPHTPAPPSVPAAPQSQPQHQQSRGVPSILGGLSIADDSTTVAPSTPSTAVAYYQEFHGPSPEPEHGGDRESTDIDDMYGEEPELPMNNTATRAAEGDGGALSAYRPSHSHSQSQSQLPHPSGGRPMPNPPVPPPRRPRTGSSPSASTSIFTPPGPPPHLPTGGNKGGKGYYDPVWYPDVLQAQLGVSSAGGPGGSSSGGAGSGNRSGGGGAASGGTGGRPRTKRPVI